MIKTESAIKGGLHMHAHGENTTGLRHLTRHFFSYSLDNVTLRNIKHAHYGPRAFFM